MTFQSLVTFTFISVGMLSGQTAFAQSEGKDIEAIRIFQYGESCGQLAQLSRVELLGVTHPAYAEQFFDFCKTDGVYRCDDYNALLAGVGQLEDNGPTNCRYIPRQ